MTTTPRDDERIETTVEAPVAPAAPALQALDLGGLAAIGVVCDIDDPDCNPMAFAGTDGAPAMTGGADEA